MPTAALLLAFGGLLTAFGLYSLGRAQTAQSPAITSPPGLLAPILVGAIGGAVGGFTAFPSSPIVIWLGLTGASKQQTRRVAQPFTLAMQLVGNATGVHPYHLLWADKVFITKGAVAKLEEVLG